MDHWEEKRDDRIIGRYALLEPGGYVRSVYYAVDGSSGFRSTVQTRMLGCCNLSISFTFLLICFIIGAPRSTHKIQPSSVPYQHHVPIAFV